MKEDFDLRTDPCAETENFRWRPFVASSLVALALAGLSVQALPGASFDRGPRIRAMHAKADAFVSGASRAKNFGDARDLRIDASPTFRAFLRFKVNVKSGDVRHVNLLLWSRSRSRAGYQVSLVEETWRERQITFLNAPSLSSDFVASGPLRAHAWEAVDVTSLVDEVSGSYDYISFALTTRSPNGFELASRETGLHGPRLVVERDGNQGKPTTTASTSTGDDPD